MLELSPCDEDSHIKCSLADLIFTNTKIIDKSKHWSLILFQESIAINRLKPSLNHGTNSQGAGLPKYKFRSTQTTEKV